MTDILSIASRKSEMYEMIMALEMDFINNFNDKLQLEDIPDAIIASANQSPDRDRSLSILRGIDFQAYIEICNANLNKLHLNIEQKDFLNKEFSKIIPIRNNVMHPRPLGVFDYPMLKEIFNCIDNILNSMIWKNVKITRNKILEHPEELLALPKYLKKSDRVIENLPTIVDYEETSFIGRRREMGEIKAKLNKNNVHILSIIGDGGTGKTAIAIKLIYDLLDDEKCRFDLILWTSLKTNELNQYEFKKIKDSIKSTSEMYRQLSDFVGVTSEISISQYLINLAKNFNMLLVLDNLETINTSEIKEFLDDFTEYGKVLITSRIGLGEMEYRYKLGGFDKNDVMEYIDTLLTLYGFEAIMSNDEKYDIAVNQLYSNPLAIKWFVRCLYNGQSIDDILKNKKELASFCMSNVYDKLSEKAHSVLDVLVVANVDLTFAELMYYLDCSLEDYKDISYAVNDLVKCNFLDDTIFKTEKKLAITSFAKEFLKLNFSDGKQLVARFKAKESIIHSFSQQVLQCNHQSPYTMKSFIITNDDKSRIVAAYYLSKALECSHKMEIDDAFKFVEFAKKLAPNYFECNKVAAFLYGTTSPLKARNEYNIAIECSKTEDEKATILIAYAGFLLRCNDYTNAIEQLSLAEKFQPCNTYIKLEKTKILGCVNDFEIAYKLLDEIQYEALSEKNKNIYLTRKADLKKRESEVFDQRDIDKKFNLIKEAFEILELSISPDREIYEYMANLLKSLTYIYFDDEVIIYILEKLEMYHSFFRNTRNFKEFQNNMKTKINGIANPQYKSSVLKYITNIEDLLDELEEDEGIVYALHTDKNFGFFKTKDYLKGVYFKLQDRISSIQIGDIIKFEKIITTEKGYMANNIISFYSKICSNNS
jgi:GTPase SAR1 family protein